MEQEQPRKRGTGFRLILRSIVKTALIAVNVLLMIKGKSPLDPTEVKGKKKPNGEQ